MWHVLYTLFLLGFVGSSAVGQSYIGAGNNEGISVTASHEYQDPLWENSSTAGATVDGKGLDYPRFQAARFLEQSTLGFESEDIDLVLTLGEEGWIQEQFSLPMSSTLQELNSIWDIIKDSLIANGQEIPRRPNSNIFQYAWWHLNMTSGDLLRQKVAAALSQIWVVSRNSDLRGYGAGLASYYDVLATHAFGNYRDLMYDVTMHPVMGYYLSHANNPKSDTIIGRFPDENYARELKQLFTIGLFELNEDGTQKTTGGGQSIPTYDNDDVIEYSKIFTGLSYGAIHPSYSRELGFGINKNNCDLTVPMIMYDMDDPTTNRDDEDQHENGTKLLLGGEIVPDGQSGIEDINQALDNLFNHPNVGPFISYRLIQRLVKSNPTPAYVGRVAQAFADNGSGVRGDMKAVIAAILLDDEARDPTYQAIDRNGRLKEPLFRFTQFARAIDKDNEQERYWNNTNGFSDDAGQAILSAPSVFNFYLPIDGPNGPLEESGLVAPEFKLHDAKFSVGYINEVYDWTRNGRLFQVSGRDYIGGTTWDITALEPIAQDVEHYINWIDKNITHGKLSDYNRSLLRVALARFESSRNNYLSDRVRMGMYLALISSDYNLSK